MWNVVVVHWHFSSGTRASHIQVALAMATVTVFIIHITIIDNFLLDYITGSILLLVPVVLCREF